MDLKAKILAARKKLVPLEIEDWGFPVFVRRMTSGDREVYQAETKKADGNWPQEQRIIISLCLCDEDGVPIFANPDELKTIDSKVLDTISSAISALSGVTKEAAEEIEKKLKSAESSGSGTSSPANSTAQ